MPNYSLAYKRKLIARMFEPENLSPNRLAVITGVGKTTLWRWKLETQMDPQQPQQPIPKATHSPDQKLSILFQSQSLTGQDLGHFLRAEGLTLEQLEQWKSQALTSLKHNAPDFKHQAKQVQSLARQNKALSRELKRKDAALAETAALLVLSKKVQQLWGDEDDVIAATSDDLS